MLEAELTEDRAAVFHLPVVLCFIVTGAGSAFANASVFFQFEFLHLLVHTTLSQHKMLTASAPPTLLCPKFLLAVRPGCSHRPEVRVVICRSQDPLCKLTSDFA